MIHTAISIFHDYHFPFFAIAFLLLGMHQSSPTEYQSDWSPVLLRYPVRLGTSKGLVTSRTGYLRRTGIQSNWVTSHDWNWCIPTSRVFEMRIFLSSNLKKNEKVQVLLMKLFCILIYDRSIERLWTAKKNLCILK